MTEQDAADRYPAGGEGMSLRYKEAVERVIGRVPVKNGVVDIDSIWIETSLPYTILEEILRRDDLKLPENVERINLTSRIRRKEKRNGKTKHR